MKITYSLFDQFQTYNQDNNLESDKINFLLTNKKCDFLNFGAQKNSSKFQGMYYTNTKNLDVFKILDEVIVSNQEVEEVIYEGYKVKRKFKSMVESYGADTFNDDRIEDSFFLGPTGGCVYEIKNYNGDIKIDLDMKKLNDFDEWGRDYKIIKENDILIVEYTKKVDDGEDYKLYFGIKSQNFVYNLIENFEKKEYFYSKLRGTDFTRYVYRLMSVSIFDSKKIIFGAGFSIGEVREQIELLELHQSELEGFEKVLFNEATSQVDFEKPLSQDSKLAYELSSNAVYKFLSNEIGFNNIGHGSFAGYPWFAQIWTRDELVGLRALINFGENKIVKQKINEYLSLINSETGQVRRLNDNSAFYSVDTTFWLAKRIEDFIFALDEKNKLASIYNKSELNNIYSKLTKAFSNIISNFWDNDKELLKVKQGDSWMDTLDTNYTLDIQAQLLGFVSTLGVLAAMLNKKEDAAHYLDFESLLREKISDVYFNDGKLYNDLENTKVTSNIFLAYYFAPSLFLKKNWGIIFDNCLKELYVSWGGVSSLSKKDSNFHLNYSGENNDSYHMGDVWFWQNNMAAIALNDLNEKKYRKIITSILLSSTKDILTYGCVGFASEISSASSQKSEGCFAQLWSSSTYLEMIDSIFSRK